MVKPSVGVGDSYLIWPSGCLNDGVHLKAWYLSNRDIKYKYSKRSLC